MRDTRKQGPLLTIDETRFVLDGEPIDMWGIRTASATASDAQCDHLIEQLDAYAEFGINAVTVFYSGCSGAYYDPFSPDGSVIDTEHQTRMERIIDACAARDMIVIVGIFYQRVEYELTDSAAVREAVRTVTDALQPYGNVIINIANEHSSGLYRRFADRFDFRDPDNIIELCEAVHDIDPDRLVGGGGYHPETCAVIGRDPAADLVMFDTGLESLTQFDSGAVYDRLVRAGVRDKPLVNVETFGGWTGDFPRGVFPTAVRQAYEEEVARTAAREGLSLFFHNNNWCQTPNRPMRYDLGGAGTPEEPGIRWYAELVASVRARD